MKQKLADMTERERYSFFGALFFVVATLLWLFVYEPITEGRHRLRNTLVKKEADLTEARNLANAIIALRSEVTRFEQQMKSRPPSQTPLDAIKSFAGAAGLDDKLAGITPAPAAPSGGYLETVVSVNLEKISLGDLVRFLEAVQLGGVRVKRMSVVPEFDDPTLLSADVAVSFFEIAS